jgi:hypothetical protein
MTLSAVFLLLHEACMPALDVLRAITINAAEMLGCQDRIGSIDPPNSPTSSPFPSIRSPTFTSCNESDRDERWASHQRSKVDTRFCLPVQTTPG